MEILGGQDFLIHMLPKGEVFMLTDQNGEMIVQEWSLFFTSGNSYLE